MSKDSINILVEEGFTDEHLAFFKNYYNIENVYNFIDAYNGKIDVSSVSLMVFLGDDDLTPRYYNEANNDEFLKYNPSKDKLARHTFYSYNNIPKIGINRGALLLTAFNSGTIISKADNHNETHQIHYSMREGTIYNIVIEGNHKSLMYPYKIKDYKILAWSKRFRSDNYKDSEGNDFKIKKTDFLESEIICYNKWRELAFQPNIHKTDSYKNNALLAINRTMEEFSFRNEIKMKQYESEDSSLTIKEIEEW